MRRRIRPIFGKRALVWKLLAALAAMVLLGHAPTPDWHCFGLDICTASASEKDKEEESVDLEKDWDVNKEIVSQKSSSDLDADEAASKENSLFTWRIKTAFQNYVNTRRELHFEDAYKKNELSARLEARYGPDDNYLLSTTDVAFFPTFLNDTIGSDYVYSPESKTSRNLRISGKYSEVIFRELYYNWQTEKYRVRVGNQIYGWGTADFMNSTAYFNPSDFRELIFKDQDHTKLGVPSLSGMAFFDGFTVETVFVPVHTPAALPATGNFWAPKKVEGDYPLIFGDSDPMDANSKNLGYGARINGTVQGMDMSVSGYHGPDRDPLFLPYSTMMVENQPVSLKLKPVYDIVDYIGFDIAYTYGDFAFQTEAAYSPNKTGFVTQDEERPQYMTFPFDTRRSDFVSYSVGVNYFIPLQKIFSGHSGESLLTLEWYQANYLDNDLGRPQITDFLTFRFQDAYFSERIKMSLTGIVETHNGGILWWPKCGYDFQNGWEAELGYVGITGHGEKNYEEDSLFYYFKDNDFIMVIIRYAFP